MSVVLVCAGVLTAVSAGLAWLLCRAAKEGDRREVPVCATCRETAVCVPGSRCAACEYAATRPTYRCLACGADVPCEGALCARCRVDYFAALDRFRAGAR
jgi:hypothetical protein